jgi:hypothetical protein
LIAGLVAEALSGLYRIDQAYTNTLLQAESLQASALNFNTDIITEVLSTRAYLISGKNSAATRR